MVGLHPPFYGDPMQRKGLIVSSLRGFLFIFSLVTPLGKKSDVQGRINEAAADERKFWVMQTLWL